MLLAAALLLAVQPTTAEPCPMRIEVTRTGAYYTHRMQARFRTSPETLAQDLDGGCYGNVPVSSVEVRLPPQAPPARIDQLMQLLAAHGWPKERVRVAPASR